MDDFLVEPDIRIIQSADQTTYWIQVSSPARMNYLELLTHLEQYLFECSEAFAERDESLLEEN